MIRFLAFLIALLLTPVANAAERGPLVLAAASMQESLSAAADAWAARGHARPILSFAASSALARQVGAGAPADLFVSADMEWMDALDKDGLLRRGSSAVLVGNRLVLIAPADQPVRVRIATSFPIARALGKSRLAMADPDSVPAGRYGRAALEKLRVWPSVANRIARAENVRAALALVERGEARLGIVYATDARASTKVRVAGVFPAASHAPIRYPIALIARSRHADAEPFRRFLLSRAGRAIFLAHGFTAP